jgi:SAM-dependent methyltransferase
MAFNRDEFVTFCKDKYDASWYGDTKSGTGSTLAYTSGLVDFLTSFITRHKVTRILDVPCGDMTWMSRVIQRSPPLEYVGVDISPKSVARAQENCPAATLFSGDLMKFPFAGSDLIVCRDLMFHCSLDMGLEILDKVKKSGCRFFGATTFDYPENTDVDEYGWRPLTLEKPPFILPPPLESHREPQHKSTTDYEVRSHPPRYFSIYSMGDVSTSISKIRNV